MTNGSRRLRSGIAAAALAVLLGAGAVATIAQEPSTEQCLDPAICPILYVRLAKQETEPFLYRGRVMDEKHPRYEDYERALRTFPDVRSCLTKDERAKPQPDLRQIDWSAIRSIKDIDVCVFRIASSADGLETIKTWLLYNDFISDGEARLYGKNYVPKHETDPVYTLSAHLTLEKFRTIISRLWIERLLGYEGIRNYSISIFFSQTFQVVGVGSIGNSILN
jgi:hypothetical protein